MPPAQTCGFEILVASLRLENDLHDRSTVETHAFDSDPRWKAFTASLIKYGYFRNELPGSRRYRELEQRAKDAYLVDVVADRPDSDDDGCAPSADNGPQAPPPPPTLPSPPSRRRPRRRKAGRQLFLDGGYSRRLGGH
ncbi:MAG: hypothetical protein BJ554DRAFT_3746, partial [Olpidium bornovanus]